MAYRIRISISRRPGFKIKLNLKLRAQILGTHSEPFCYRFCYHLESCYLFYRVSSVFTGFDSVLMGFARWYQVLLSFTGFCWVVPCFTEFLRVAIRVGKTRPERESGQRKVKGDWPPPAANRRARNATLSKTQRRTKQKKTTADRISGKTKPSYRLLHFGYRVFHSERLGFTGF